MSKWSEAAAAGCVGNNESKQSEPIHDPAAGPGLACAHHHEQTVRGRGGGAYIHYYQQTVRSQKGTLRGAMPPRGPSTP